MPHRSTRHIAVTLGLLLGLSACGRSAPDETELLQGSTESPSTTSAVVTTAVAGPTTTTAPPPTTQPTYVIQQGDSLSVIARRFGVELDALAEFNGITDVDSIQVGQTLSIPPPGYAAGD